MTSPSVPTVDAAVEDLASTTQLFLLQREHYILGMFITITIAICRHANLPLSPGTRKIFNINLEKM